MQVETHGELATRSHGLHVRAVQNDSREATFVASTDAVDAHGEVVEQTWKLDRFLSNPVILFAHNSRELPIGTAKDVGVKDGKLMVTVKFVTAEKNPKAESVWQMVRDGELRAVSVGFVPNTVRVEMRNGAEVYVLGDNELHEISVVPIPSNPEALATMKAKALAEARNTARGAEKGPTVDAKQIETRLAEVEAKMGKLSDERDALGARNKELEAEVESLKGDAVAASRALAEATAALADANAAIVERDVDALIGKKITPAERDAMIKLAKKDRESFDAIVEARPELALTGKIVGDLATTETRSAEGNASDELAALALNSAEL